ncbi:MAG: tyrosine-type recombinase/integrase [Clostridia bacterium]
MKNEKEFIGPFKDVLPRYVEYKRSQGFSYSNSTYRALRTMDNFFNKYYKLSEVILTKEMVLNFIKTRENEASSTISLRCTFIRGFATYLKEIGYSEVYILPTYYIPKCTTAFIPFIFSTEQILMLFNIIDNYPFKSKYLKKHKIYSALFRLLYGCGLRVGEALSLKVKDIDFSNSIIHILKSKNNTSRMVCMSSSLSDFLKAYVKESNLSIEDWLFPSPRGEHYSQDSIRDSFKLFCEKAHIYTSNNKYPRVHDLRHTFSVHALRKMVSNGMDIYCALPYLSAFLGHTSIYSTEKYLRLCREDFDSITNNNYEIFKEVNYEK